LYFIEHERGVGRFGYADYFAMGYIPSILTTRKVMERTSRTLEYVYDDFCAYQLAKMTGNKFYEELFAKHIYNYKNVYDPSDHFVKARDAKGNWDPNFNPYEWGGPFVEGNAWHWKWSVFHDVKGLIDLVGGEKQFVKELDELFFEAKSDSIMPGGYGEVIHEISEVAAANMGQHAPGNEPTFHVPYLYTYAGEPWKCQQLIRRIMTQCFNSSPKGFPGDEDGGSMASFYVLSAMGFYSVTPGIDQYVIGSPLFDKVTLTLENGNKFTIVADSNSQDNVYINSATLNGKPYSKNWLSHADIMNGGELKFVMGNQPNMQRGMLDEDKPYSVGSSK
jgi:predicted alpha-1,2-mannosidase